MRRLIWLIVIIAVLWWAWWAAASTVLQHSVITWLEDRRSAGWKAEISESTKHGFPLSLHARLRNLSIADPTSKVSVDTPQLDLLAATYWPGYMSVIVPDAPIFISTATGQLTVQAQDAQADLHLRPGVALQLQGINAVSGPWKIAGSENDLLSADDLNIAIKQDGTLPETYHFDTQVTKLSPGTLIRETLSLPTHWPASFDRFTADLSITFDTPWDRTSVIRQHPQPRTISLRQINAAWGDLRISADGEVSIDTLGVPTGAIAIILTNWRQLMNSAEASGALPTKMRAQAELMLSALSSLGGSPDDLNLTLSFSNGNMVLGPVSLGPAPRLILR